MGVALVGEGEDLNLRVLIAEQEDLWMKPNMFSLLAKLVLLDNINRTREWHLVWEQFAQQENLVLGKDLRPQTAPVAAKWVCIVLSILG